MNHMKIRNRVIASILEMEAMFYKVKQKMLGGKRSGRIKVVFICQYIPAWNKTKQLYETLKRDPRFETIMLCVPSDISRETLSGQENDTWQYFMSRGYDGKNAVMEDGTWLDLRGVMPDYVFYTRPYNAYMPRGYQTRYVARYAKVCILMYGMSFTEEDTKVVLPRDFFRNAYFYFAETECMRDICMQRYKITQFLGLRKTVFLGMPAMLDILKSKNQGKGSWAFSNNDFRIMWTPRWTSDLKLGGTNFLDFYQPLLKYAEDNQDMDFLFRPHPMAFDNFLRTGEMTEQEISDYKERCRNLVNVQLDLAQEYTETFWQTDVLVSDMSGIMPEFFITGKPVIFCVSNLVLELNAFIKKMCEGCYIAKNIGEVFSYIENIKNGKDVLAEKRKELCKELFGEDLEQIPVRIMEEIVNDCK